MPSIFTQSKIQATDHKKTVQHDKTGEDLRPGSRYHIPRPNLAVAIGRSRPSASVPSTAHTQTRHVVHRASRPSARAPLASRHHHGVTARHGASRRGAESLTELDPRSRSSSMPEGGGGRRSPGSAALAGGPDRPAPPPPQIDTAPRDGRQSGQSRET